MSNDVIEQKSWIKKSWKWFVPLIGIVLILIFSVFPSGFDKILGDYSKAYTDSKLYETALERVRLNERIKEVLGAVEPIDVMTILNGSVDYSDDNKSVNSTIKISCEKGKAMLDISADRIDEIWIYKKINVRIKNPPEKKETIEIVKPTNLSSK
ncbi:MAG: cytochrome c oxidase assembly factor Coa1 family protein [Flavobacteriaceae bacterium]|nr:cytochrome c oxidase assembly factor Coa1 family protein [Flavobacteriaceae bacterium]MDZ4149344.1 cytochrome c oxidase assembly factor Coa1 family protein [Flavobacteriaceae bacterium]